MSEVHGITSTWGGTGQKYKYSTKQNWSTDGTMGRFMFHNDSRFIAYCRLRPLSSSESFMEGDGKDVYTRDKGTSAVHDRGAYSLHSRVFHTIVLGS